MTPRGLTTSPIPVGNEILDLEFDFLKRQLIARISRGELRTLTLEPQWSLTFIVGSRIC